MFLLMNGFDGWAIPGFRVFRFNKVYDKFEVVWEYCLSESGMGRVYPL